MHQSRRLILYHYWVAFAVFLPAVLLGAWQMLMRSPLPAPLDDSAAYYASVTLHGTVMAYVVTTFFADLLYTMLNPRIRQSVIK